MYNCDFLFWLSNLTNFAQKKEVCQNRFYFIENIRIAEYLSKFFIFDISCPGFLAKFGRYLVLKESISFFIRSLQKIPRLCFLIKKRNLMNLTSNEPNWAMLKTFPFQRKRFFFKYHELLLHRIMY